MRIGIEWFLIDNTLMNALIFSLAAVLAGVRVRWWRSLSASLIGAVYALLSLSILPVLQSPLCKAILFLAFALPLFRSGRGYLTSLLCVFISAFFMGGIVLFLTLLFGGSVEKNGTLIGTLPLRAALLGGLVCAVAPRAIRRLIQLRRIKECMVPVRIRLGEMEWRLNGIIDSGNLVTEPITGLPVVFVNFGIEGNIPIPYVTANGKAVCHGCRPDSIKLRLGAWIEVDAVVAMAAESLKHCDAIVPQILLTEDWRLLNEEKPAFQTALAHIKALLQKGKAAILYSFGRNPAAPARGRGGDAVYPGKQDRRRRKEQTD